MQQTRGEKLDTKQASSTPAISPRAMEFFAKIAGEDMEVDAKELQEVLNHALKKGLIAIKSIFSK